MNEFEYGDDLKKYTAVKSFQAIFKPNANFHYRAESAEEILSDSKKLRTMIRAVSYTHLALGRESYISYVVPSEVRLILPQVTDGILATLRNDVSDWLVRHQDNWTAKDWEKLYQAVVKEQEKRKNSNGRNNTKGNNGPAL